MSNDLLKYIDFSIWSMVVGVTMVVIAFAIIITYRDPNDEKGADALHSKDGLDDN